MWSNLEIGITGASGTLGKSLIKSLKSKGAIVTGLSHRRIDIRKEFKEEETPQRLVQWRCGEEASLEKTLSKLDILILNHGFNPKSGTSNHDINQAIQINALSTWRLIETFESISKKASKSSRIKEIWVNTSEAEVQPALSPVYEISKRLIGQLVSIKWSNLDNHKQKHLRIRKMILGPFRSKLNPIGLMNAESVSNQIIRQAELDLNLIIVTPNPITYITAPLSELGRLSYSKMIKRIGI